MAQRAGDFLRRPLVRNKYGAKKSVVNGIKFDSKAEAARYADLLLMQRAGEISDLTPHEVFPLEVNGELVCRYISDSSYVRDLGAGKTYRVVEDVKGMRIGPAWAVFRIKAKLFHALMGYDIEIYPPALIRKSKRSASPRALPATPRSTRRA